MEFANVEESEYDLGNTSVRMVRLGKIVQLLFSNREDARIYLFTAEARQEIGCEGFCRTVLRTSGPSSD